MKDAISQARVNSLHPRIRQEVHDLIEKVEAKMPGAAVRIVQGLRTFAEQDALYAQGRTKPGKIVTNSKAGQSYHEYGLALDFALLYDIAGDGKYTTMSWNTLKDFDKDGEADWMEVVDVFEEAGYVWGGRFHSIRDNPHIEKTFGLTWKQMLDKYNKKDFIPGTNYITLPM